MLFFPNATIYISDLKTIKNQDCMRLTFLQNLDRQRIREEYEVKYYQLY